MFAILYVVELQIINLLPQSKFDSISLPIITFY